MRAGTRLGSDARHELAGDAVALAALEAAVGPNDLAFYAHARSLFAREGR